MAFSDEGPYSVAGNERWNSSLVNERQDWSIAKLCSNRFHVKWWKGIGDTFSGQSYLGSRDRSLDHSQLRHSIRAVIFFSRTTVVGEGSPTRYAAVA